ncbi:PREDICTED: solute carrier family 2, facilitated glucose transporter member 3-like, partial [Rhagoletis zephyria]|uniref:solute carrier family 2, facilitated glucose transporter member 3-like n=1 Tax=Rhagoletis zephyria TaxID=28612 RepID=UPI0008119C86
MGVVNTPEATFKDFFNYTLSLSRRSVVVVDRSQIELLWSVAVSLLLVGAFIGCTFTGYLADRIGRRGLLILNALLGLLGAALCWMAKFLGPSFSLPVFITGRFISGLHTGVGSSLVPMYLIEIAPKNGGGGGGGGGLATALGVLHAEAWLNFATIAIILAYVLFFAIGQGPIPFMIGGELFDQSTMAIGMSIGCFVNWFCNFLI